MTLQHARAGGIKYTDYAVGKPVWQSTTLTYDCVTHAMKPRPPDETLTNGAIAYYQTASWLFKNGRQRELTPLEWKSDRPAETPPLAARK